METREQGGGRYTEVDLLRSLAIVLMVVYHTAFDLWYFYGFDIDVFSGWWWLIARSTATLFLLLVGISFVLSSRNCLDESSIWKKSFRRGVIVFACAMFITLVTWMFDSAVYIRFGVLHCIAISLFVLPLFRRLGSWNIVVGAGIVFLGFLIKEQNSTISLLIPFGFIPTDFATLDYFPLFPWLGVIVIGVGIGQFLFWTSLWGERTRESHLIFRILGQHSLAIYLLHQPILLAILRLFLGSPL
ncbi:hypothetical protein A2635_00460 [Candidatus Peribacteria bacterium RIFCSPHIGHO2_01_FULL_51_9]|nr:MAG: hypothetical protein A2635_00460 [Candidatus Peribacteria bacterium RIFCSPHIGHO2_01_FULL_51_9]